MIEGHEQVKTLLKQAALAKREASRSADKAAEHVFYLEEAARLCPENAKVQEQAKKARATIDEAALPMLEKLHISTKPAPPPGVQKGEEAAGPQEGGAVDAKTAQVMARLAEARAAKAQADLEKCARSGTHCCIPVEHEGSRVVKLEAETDLPQPGLVVHAERRECASKGRGQGLFATKDIPSRETVVQVRPALSVIFDDSVEHACGFCFATGKHAKLTPCAGGCGKFVFCERCAGITRLREWHSLECSKYNKLPAAALKGDTSVIRTLLRYASLYEFTTAAIEQGPAACGDWADRSMGKEPGALLNELIGHATDVNPAMLATLSRLSGLPSETISRLIYQIRTNAGSIIRNRRKVGCSLSAHMGFANHDCDPNAQPNIDEEGYVVFTSFREIKEGEEITISYVDSGMPLEERRAVLKEHYGFDCDCERCHAQMNKAQAKKDKKEAKKEKKKKKK